MGFNFDLEIWSESMGLSDQPGSMPWRMGPSNQQASKHQQFIDKKQKVKTKRHKEAQDGSILPGAASREEEKKHCLDFTPRILHSTFYTPLPILIPSLIFDRKL